MAKRLSRVEQTERTRKRLLEAATTVIASEGYEAASVDDIAAAAGLTKGAVYSRFASKEELLLALFEERSAEGLTGIQAILDSDAGLDERMAALDRWQAADPARVRVWALLEMELALAAARQPALRKRLVRQQREARQLIAGGLEREAAKLGVKLPMPSEELSLVLEALSDGLTQLRLVDPAAVPGDLFSRVLRRLLGLPG